LKACGYTVQAREDVRRGSMAVEEVDSSKFWMYFKE
jgi:hypothetical protein